MVCCTSCRVPAESCSAIASAIAQWGSPEITSNPASRHHTDQAALFAKGQFKPVRFTEADIKANLEREYRP